MRGLAGWPCVRVRACVHRGAAVCLRCAVLCCAELSGKVVAGPGLPHDPQCYLTTCQLCTGRTDSLPPPQPPSPPRLAPPREGTIGLSNLLQPLVSQSVSQSVVAASSPPSPPPSPWCSVDHSCRLVALPLLLCWAGRGGARRSCVHSIVWKSTAVCMLCGCTALYGCSLYYLLFPRAAAARGGAGRSGDKVGGGSTPPCHPARHSPYYTPQQPP